MCSPSPRAGLTGSYVALLLLLFPPTLFLEKYTAPPPGPVLRTASDIVRSMTHKRRSSGLNSSYRATSQSNTSGIIGKQLTTRGLSGLHSGVVVESDEDIGEQSQPLTTALETDAVQVHPGAKSNDAVTVDICAAACN